MKTLILDAYNVIHKVPSLSAKLKTGLESARSALVDFVINWKRNNYFHGNIYLVFDGGDDIAPFHEPKRAGVSCIFTRSREEADDRIIGMVRRSENAGDIMVISSDNKVINGCRAHGAWIKGPEFLTETKKKKKAVSEARSKKEISSAQQREIDEHYRKALGL